MSKLKVVTKDSEPQGFHWREGWYFHRLLDGSVQIHVAGVLDPVTIPPDEWASIVAHVADGGTAHSYERATYVHGLGDDL